LNELVLIGLGLYDEKHITIRGLEELKKADTAFIELYTSLMPGLSMRKLEEMAGPRGIEPLTYGLRASARSRRTSPPLCLAELRAHKRILLLWKQLS
jgi:hypothetical protein